MKWIKQYKFNENIKLNDKKAKQACIRFNHIFNHFGIWAEPGPSTSPAIGTINMMFNFAAELENWYSNPGMLNIFSVIFNPKHIYQAQPYIDKKRLAGLNICYVLKDKTNRKRLSQDTNDLIITYYDVIDVNTNNKYFESLVESLRLFIEDDWNGFILTVETQPMASRPIFFDLVRTIIHEYVNDINQNIFKVIFKFLSQEKDAYVYFSRLKGTKYEEEFTKLGHGDVFSSAGKMGEMGF